MRLRFLVPILLLSLASAAIGCSGPKGIDVQQPIASEPTPSSEHPPDSIQPSTDATQTSDLTKSLLPMASPSVEPSYRWSKPPEGSEYRPLPNGELLVWTEVLVKREDSQPVSISAQGSDGKVLWTRQMDALVRDIKRIDVSPSGESVAIVRRNGDVLVLSTTDGKDVATFHVDLTNPETDSVNLIANGRFLAVRSRTKSGVVPWTVAVYPVKTGATVAYRNNGMVVHVSPYHDVVLGLEALQGKFVHVVDSSGPVGDIPYEYQVQQEPVELSSSADGQLVYTWSESKGLGVYDRKLQHLFSVSASSFSDVDLAAVGKVVWHQIAPGRLEVVDAVGKAIPFTYDPAKITPGRVMPGGEGVFEVKNGNQKAECIVLTSGAIFGCLPSVDFETATVNGRTFFWTELDDGTVAGYKF